MNTLIPLFILPSIIAIGIIDYAFLRKWLKCPNCNQKLHWTNFIVPTALEMLMFLAGIWIGVSIK